MTLITSDDGQQLLLDQLRGEGVEFAEFMDQPATDHTGILPTGETLKKLSSAAHREFLSSETSRREFVSKATSNWQRYNLQRYDEAELLLADQVNITTPLIRSRVDQAHGSMYASLSLTPFYSAQTDSGQGDEITTHFEAAFEEQLNRADFANAFDNALRSSLVAGLGILKATTTEDEEGRPRLDIEPVDVRDLFMAPHNVRDLQQCTMIAQRYYEPQGWLKDMALEGIFDKKAVDSIVPVTSRDEDDSTATDRDLHGLTPDDIGEESGMVELLEMYIRFRPAKDQPAEMWRVYVARQGFHVLRAEPWGDGYPFWALRHQRGGNTIFAPSFADTLKDLQYGKDMLYSLSYEADRMSVAPFVQYDPLSPAADWLAERQREAGSNKAMRLLPGDLVPSRGGSDLQFNYHQPANMAVTARMNDIEQMAGVATIPVLPLQSYRSATEHRFSQANVTTKESQMLKVLRGDLTRFAEYVKRLFIQYICTPDGENLVFQHGTEQISAMEAQLAATRFEPRGMTTQADQMQVAAASGEAFQLAMTLAAQKPVLMQTGMWEQVYNAARIRLESLGFQKYKEVLGDDPSTDPRVKSLIPDPARELAASMALMQAQAGQNPMLAAGQPPTGEPMRGSDAAPTVMPGGNPLMPGAEGEML